MSHRILLIFCSLILFLSSLNAIEYQKNPYRSMLYSALLPGGGQLYNEAYIKTGVVIGLQAYLVSLAIHNNDKLDYYRDLYNSTNNSGYLIKRNEYHDKLRSDYWWMGTVLVLSVADAFVDAHLYNYESEKNKVKLRFEDKLLQVEYQF